MFASYGSGVLKEIKNADAVIMAIETDISYNIRVEEMILDKWTIMQLEV